MKNDDISKVYLLSVPLENDYKHTLYFTNQSSQYNYFKSKVIDSSEEFNYLRKDNLIYYPAHYDDIYNANYVMYQNTKYTDKWFYAFIKELKYENDECTIIEIETDVIQTWLFDYTIKPSFVEREHVDNDTIGKHTIPEQLETGDYIVNQHLSDDKNDKLTMVMGATLTPGEMVSLGGGNYNGIPSGVRYYRIPDIATLNSHIKTYSNGHADAITSLFIAPQYLTGEQNENYIQDSNNEATFELGISKITKLNGYTPRNKKLLTFPYCYINMSNGIGASAVYRQEVWNTNDNNEMVFKVSGVLTPGCSIRGVPINYNGDGLSFDEGITLGKFPQLNWTTDQYTNWLTQNGVNIGVSVGSSILQVVGGIAAASTGAGAVAGAGMITSGALGVASSLGQIYQQSFTPPQASGNLNSGDVTTAMGGNRFHCLKMTIKKEYAQLIDEYFDMYGYKVNRVKVPNKNHRNKYWFTKTIDVNIDGKLPQNDLQKIKDCYNNGITFWKNASEIQNYSLTNGIV